MKKVWLVFVSLAGILWLTLLAGWIKGQIMNNPWNFAFIAQRSREYNPGSQIKKKPICGNKKLEHPEQCEYWAGCPSKNQWCDFDDCKCKNVSGDPCWWGICPPSYGDSYGRNPNNGNPTGYGDSNANVSWSWNPKLIINYTTWSTWLDYKCSILDPKLYPIQDVGFGVRTYPYDIPQQWISLSCGVYRSLTNWSISGLPIHQGEWIKSSFFTIPSPWEYVITCSIYETFLADASALARCRTSVTVE